MNDVSAHDCIDLPSQSFVLDVGIHDQMQASHDPDRRDTSDLFPF